MIRYLVTLAVLALATLAFAQCPGGVCRPGINTTRQPLSIPLGPCPSICECGCTRGGVCLCGMVKLNLPKPPDVYGWRHDAAVADDQVFLYLNGKQVGAWCYTKEIYRPYDTRTGKWGVACEPPVKVPAREDESFRRLPPLLPWRRDPLPFLPPIPRVSQQTIMTGATVAAALVLLTVAIRSR